MNHDALKVGESYAYILPGQRPHQPVRAQVVESPESGYVKVVLHHPDAGVSTEAVRTRELVAEWTAVPDTARFPQYTAALRADPAYSWADVAAEQYERVRTQRALAQRLAQTAGIERAMQHYAGQGGTSGRILDAGLHLNYEELGLLLDLIERGPGDLHQRFAAGGAS